MVIHGTSELRPGWRADATDANKGGTNKAIKAKKDAVDGRRDAEMGGPHVEIELTPIPGPWPSSLQLNHRQRDGPSPHKVIDCSADDRGRAVGVDVHRERHLVMPRAAQSLHDIDAPCRSSRTSQRHGHTRPDRPLLRALQDVVIAALRRRPIFSFGLRDCRNIAEAVPELEQAMNQDAAEPIGSRTAIIQIETNSGIVRMVQPAAR